MTSPKGLLLVGLLLMLMLKGIGLKGLGIVEIVEFEESEESEKIVEFEESEKIVESLSVQSPSIRIINSPSAIGSSFPQIAPLGKRCDSIAFILGKKIRLL
jgi:hypothetical protein